MKKTILLCGLCYLLLQACTYRPIIDSNGRSGTFDNSRAEDITNDLILCEKLAKDNSSFIINIGHWVLSPTMDTRYESLMRKCVSQRGHSVLN
jgi:hypothetical protein